MNTGFSMRSMRSCRSGLFTFLVATLAFGCHGGGDPAAGPSGTATQGSAREALVFADRASGTEANYTLDANEAVTAAMTGPDGRFTFSAAPDYDYVVVTQFGEDTLTGQPAIQMLAPADAQSVSLLTTLVALNPNAKPAIESLGVAYDADLSAQATPAVLFLVQSTEAIVAAVTCGLNPGGNTLLVPDINVIQQTLMTAIANGIQDQTAAQLTDPETLITTLATAVTNALVSIESNTSIATIALSAPAAVPSLAAGAAAAQSAPLPVSLVNQIVNTVANAISASTGTTTLSTTTTAAQNTIITPEAIAIIAAITDTSASTVAAQATVTARKGVNPPPIISGTPPTAATVGVRYYFKPTVTDTDHNPDFYIFIIQNKPHWASFNLLTGELTGTPRTGDVGTTTGIVITVIDILDFFQHASLPAFNITVLPVSGSSGGGG